MIDYCQRARKLLELSNRNENPFEGLTPSVPVGVNLVPGEELFDEMEAEGLKELSKFGFVLIAGGLGERLGYSSIKIDLPVCTIEEDYSYMRYYAEYALACQKRARVDEPNCVVPFCIMVSDDTHDRTVALLKSHDYFGMKEEDVYIIK